jgi:hypothetical protein
VPDSAAREPESAPIAPTMASRVFLIAFGTWLLPAACLLPAAVSAARVGGVPRRLSGIFWAGSQTQPAAERAGAERLVASAAAERAGVERVVASARRRVGDASGGGGNIKTTEPIIGILTQPCTDCPGR